MPENEQGNIGDDNFLSQLNKTTLPVDDQSKSLKSLLPLTENEQKELEKGAANEQLGVHKAIGRFGKVIQPGAREFGEIPEAQQKNAKPVGIDFTSPEDREKALEEHRQENIDKFSN